MRVKVCYYYVMVRIIVVREESLKAVSGSRESVFGACVIFLFQRLHSRDGCEGWSVVEVA